ncbi:MAG: type II toxin-antitoxin system PemK/MazF family toxin [Bacteroidota bacterium]
MPFKQGDIIDFDFVMPGTSEWRTHSCVIISCDKVYAHDSIYLCAMMTSNGTDDRFSFHLSQDDLELPSNKLTSQVRCHLISYIPEADLLRGRAQNNLPYNTIRKLTFRRLISRINEAVFEV